MTKKNLTLIVVVLDRSGSMESCKGATLEGFNKLLYEQKQVPGEARMTLIQFDDRYEPNYNNAPLEAIHLEYAPRGGTALLDAMGRSIQEVGQSLLARPEWDRPEKVIFVTITDGYENASVIFNRQQIFKMITHQREKYGWEFLYLGANQDAIAVAATFNIPATRSMSYDPTQVGTISSYGTVSQSLSNARNNAGSGTEITTEMREAYNKAAGTQTAVPVTPSKP